MKAHLAFVIASLAFLSTPVRAHTHIAEGPNSNRPLIVTAPQPGQHASSPLSVTVWTVEQLERNSAYELRDLAARTPNLSISPAGFTGGEQISIRGVHSSLGASTVGIYLDETPVQIRQNGFSADPILHLFDIARVEILRGPQGTLFGTSSLGGTIRFVSKSPSLDSTDISAEFSTTAVNGGEVGRLFSSAVGTPLIEERMGARVSLYLREQGGVIDQVDPGSGRITQYNVDDARTFGAKAALRFRPAEGLTISPSLIVQETGSDSPPIWHSNLGTDLQSFLVEQPASDRLLLGSLAVDVDVEDSTVRSISSVFRRLDERTSDYSTVFGELALGGAFPGLVPPGGTRSQTSVTQEHLSQEIRWRAIATESGLGWLVGAFLQRAKLSLSQAVREPGVETLIRELFDLTSEELFGAPLLPGGITYLGYEHVVQLDMAVFGEIGFRASPEVEITGGARVSRSEVKLHVISQGPYSGPGYLEIKERSVEWPVSPRITIAYRPNSAALLYGSWSRGYRAGGANTPVPRDSCSADLAAIGRQASPSSYGSDAVWQYELGTQVEFADRRAGIRASAFLIQWDNIQQAVMLPRCGFSFVDNLGSARNRGFELEARLSPAKGWELLVGLGHIDARFRSTVAGGLMSDGSQALLVSRGDQVPFTPRWSFSASGEYTTALGRGLRLFARAEFLFKTDYRRTVGRESLSFDERIFHGDGFESLNMRLGLLTETWSASVFCTNALNDRTVLYKSVDLVPSTGSPLRQSSIRPRALGLSVMFKI